MMHEASFVGVLQMQFLQSSKKSLAKFKTFSYDFMWNKILLLSQIGNFYNSNHK